ncbi:YqaA family protein [Phocaeicola faecicola]|jgi:membrane protein YqaA with SNARE-associated domain|uniref:YqaA family protein n=1 Tax=Phocaeicola faecicola TaxID=2739389 RepID=UPI0015B5BC97|nr:VTT domain-containing protein [Phocaeicola faecicola]MCI5744065.1 DedA family protein [Bacteroides sp.]MDD6908190.1 DedA family protein [Bacteroidaceae bacterium]MDY4872966.1 YqaA family protein [Phocaeicola faecicola]
MDAFIQLLTDWGYVGMFLSAFLAGTILPFSSEAVLLACIGLGLDPVASTLATTAGNALGGLTCYWIGHLGKMEWIEKYFKVDQKQMDKATRFIHGRGSWMALFSFLPVIGDAILIVLGLMRANIWIVAVSMTVGKLLRYALLVAAALGIIHAL